MKVLWSGLAKQHRRNIALYIAEYDADAALRVLDLFTGAGIKLSKFPYAGPEGRVIGTRELTVHKHYIVVYKVSEKCITILAILHSSQQYPPE